LLFGLHPWPAAWIGFSATVPSSGFDGLQKIVTAFVSREDAVSPAPEGWLGYNRWYFLIH